MIKIFIPLLGFLFFLSANIFADDIENIPHVDRKAMDSFQFDYANAAQHKAFAIAPGGAWSWTAGKSSLDEAKTSALEACGKYTKQNCVLYAADDEISFDRETWPTLWRPYKNRKQVAVSASGVNPGERFPDMLFTDPAGKKKSIADLKGKVVFVHIWGCWCPSCQYEFTALIDLYQILKDVTGGQVEFVILQAREHVDDARKWVKSKGFEVLPISDSGVISAEDKQFYIKGGGRIADREIARVFPASYVLDKHGAVIFSHMGSVANWSQYVNFFKDAVENSGK